MDSQHERQQSRLEARSEAYSRQGRPAKGLSASRDRSQHLHPGGLGKEPQVQHPIEPRTQTGQGRQGHQFFRTVRKILPAKRWRKWKKNKEAINLSVKLADKAEPVTGYPAGYPPPPPYSEIINRPPNQGYQSFPPPYSHDIGPPNQGYRPYPPPYPVYYPPVPAYSQDYNIGPPNQGYYQTFPPTYPPPNQGYNPHLPPYPPVYTRPPNQSYQRSRPPPSQGYGAFANSVFLQITKDFIDTGVGKFFSNGNNDGSYDGGPYGTFFSNGNNDGSYDGGPYGTFLSDGSYDGGP